MVLFESLSLLEMRCALECLNVYDLQSLGLLCTTYGITQCVVQQYHTHVCLDIFEFM